MIRKLMGIFAMVCLLSTTVVAEEAAHTEGPVKIHDFIEETCMEESDFGIRYLVPDSWSEKVVYDEDEVYYEADTAQMIVYKDKRIEGDHLTEADAKEYLANCAAGDDITDFTIKSLDQTLLICDGSDAYRADITALIDETPVSMRNYIFAVNGTMTGLMYVEFVPDQYDRKADIEKVFKSITLEGETEKAVKPAMDFDDFFQTWISDSFLGTLEAPTIGTPVTIDLKQGISTVVMKDLSLDDMLTYAESVLPECGYVGNVHATEQEDYYEYHAESVSNIFTARFYYHDEYVEYTVCALPTPTN